MGGIMPTLPVQPRNPRGTMRFYMTNSAETLSTLLSCFSTVATVEAEYGGTEVMGSSDLLTLNHHVRPERACPCSLENDMFSEVRPVIQAVGLSHFDLDTLGGCLALLGMKPVAPAFWAVAAYVDTHGPHRAQQCPEWTEEVQAQLNAFWAWSQKNRLFPDRSGKVTDVTEFIWGAAEVLAAIFDGDQELLGAGAEMARAEEELRVSSFVSEGVSFVGLRVVLRSAGAFTNHLYYDSHGEPVDMVVAFNATYGSVTVSKAGDFGPNCKDFVQGLWGELAGGHAGIAGSPRGQQMTLNDAVQAFEALLGIKPWQPSRGPTEVVER